MKKKNIILFRIFIIIIGISLILINAQNFYRITTFKTDENFYINLPSQYYVTQQIKASVFQKDSNIYIDCHLSIGNLIYQINDSVPKNIKDFKSLIDNAADEFEVTFVNNKNVWLNNDMSIKFNKAILKKKNLPDEFVKIIESAVLITYVKEGGASYKSGIQVGDYITKINGEEFKDAFEANDFILKGESGSYLNYEILRDNKLQEFQVQLIKFKVSINYLLLITCGLILIGLGMFIAVKRPNIKGARILGIAFILLGYYLTALIIGVRVHGRFQYHLYFLMLISGSLSFPVFFHSFLYFPKERKELFERKWLIIAPYILGTVIFLLSIFNVFILLNGVIDYILLLYFKTLIPLIFLYVFIINITLRKVTSKEISKMCRAILYSILLILVSGILGVILHFYEIHYFRYVYSNSLFLIPLSYIYVIGRYKIFNIEFRIRKNVQYIFISALWKLSLIAIIVLFIWMISNVKYEIPNLHFTGSAIEVLENPLTPDMQEFYRNISLIICSIFTAFIFHKINKRGQKIINKKYFRTRYDYRRASSGFSQILARNMSTNDLAINIMDELANLFHLRRGGIIFYKNDDYVAGQYFYGFNSDTLNEFIKVTGRKQVEIMKNFSGGFGIDYLDNPMKEIFQSCEFRYIIPVKSKNRIAGALLVGDRLSDSPYHNEDLDFLNTIAGQISVSIENAFLYEELTIQERIKHELELARKIQLASLPQDTPDIKGLDVSGISIPAHEVGGDFFDYLEKNGELTIIVGDVSGKGTSAALYMSKAQGIMRTLHEFELSPKSLFLRSNQLLYKYLEKSSFISAIAANINIESKTIKTARAGHLPLYYYNGILKKVEIILSPGIVLGMIKSKLYERHLQELEIKYNSGDVLLFITDGILDARNSIGQDYQVDRLISVFEKNINYDSLTIRDKIIDSVKEFSGSEIQFDDLTVVVVKIK